MFKKRGNKSNQNKAKQFKNKTFWYSLFVIMFLSVVAMVFAANEGTLTGAMIQKFNYVQSDQEILLGVKDIPCLDEVKISFNDNSNPIMIHENIDSENIYVLMPMRV